MKDINFILNGKRVTAKEGETIWQVAKRNGDHIPHLCYEPKLFQLHFFATGGLLHIDVNQEHINVLPLKYKHFLLNRLHGYKYYFHYIMLNMFYLVHILPNNRMVYIYDYNYMHYRDYYLLGLINLINFLELHNLK